MGRLLLAALLGALLLTARSGAAVTGPSAAGPPVAASSPAGAAATSPLRGVAALPAGAAAVAYVAPLTGALRVLRGFDPPITPYGPGHLGVDLAAAPGAVVRSAGPGVVTFAGSIAGRGVLVVAHPDGIRTEYEPVRALVRRGAVVRGGQPIGVLTGAHRGCAPVSCLHWGARRGPAYLDPLALLRPLAPVRLLPWPRAG